MVSAGNSGNIRRNELGGQKVGIVGLGRTGRMIADALRFLGAEVHYFSRTRKPDAEAAGIAYLPLRELLREVDILCTCLPRNTILLGAGEFRLFGNQKILINTSVGPTFRVPDLQRCLAPINGISSYAMRWVSGIMRIP